MTWSIQKILIQIKAANSYKNLLIYCIGYVTIKDLSVVKINSVNPLYLIIDKIKGYIKEINRNKYLTLAPTICWLMNILQYLRHYTFNLLMTFIPFLNVRTRKTFSITSTILIKIISSLYRRKIMENYRFLALYSNEITEGSLCWCIWSLHILTNTYTSTNFLHKVGQNFCFERL